MDPIALASFAAMRERNRLGIAIAAMIKTTGIASKLIYPMMRPASAKPSPFNLPMLLRMSERDMWPRIIAGIPARIERIVRLQIPKMRLATALPSFLASDAVGTPGGAVGGGGIAGCWLTGASG
jgi:hypothetical protein